VRATLKSADMPAFSDEFASAVVPVAAGNRKGAEHPAPFTTLNRKRITKSKTPVAVGTAREAKIHRDSCMRHGSRVKAIEIQTTAAKLHSADGKASRWLRLGNQSQEDLPPHRQLPSGSGSRHSAPTTTV
jgi:hypothetical protein